ncbi:MAG: DUF1684 domain-containing protein [Canibacter sp.]
MAAAHDETHQDTVAHNRREALLKWADERRQYVTSRVGNLALVDFQPVGSSAETVRGLPAEVWRDEDEAGVHVRPTGDGLRLLTRDGESLSVTDHVFVDRLGASGYPLLQAGQRTVDVFSLDGSDYELRIYDAGSDKLRSFADIARYEYHPDLVIRAQLDSFESTAQIPWEFSRSTDTGHTKSVPGVVRAQIDGESYEFTAFADGGYLVLVFADGTTGAESYAPGRFLRFAPPEDGSTAVELDFNHAIIPPCGFSDFYSCPIPPAENRIRTAIRAGEQKVVWKETTAS